MATYRKRSGGWRAEIFKKGIRESQTFSTKAQAMAWATQREAEILGGVDHRKNVDFTFKQTLEKYRNEVSAHKAGQRWEALRIRRFITEMPFINQPIIEIKANLIAAWRDKRLTQVASSTVRREMNLLSHVFEIARTEWQWCELNPVKYIKRPANHRPR